MPVNITDVDTFTDPIQAPADADALDRTYVLTIAQAAGNRTRNNKNRIDTIEDLIAPEFVYASAQARTRELGLPALGAGADGWSLGLNYVESEKDNYDALFDVDIPSGCVITGIEAIVTPGAARAGVNLMNASLVSINADYAAPSATRQSYGTIASDDGTTGIQTLAHTLVSPVTVDRETKSYAVKISSGNDSATNKDRIHAVRVLFNDPGPRNA